MIGMAACFAKSFAPITESLSRIHKPVMSRSSRDVLIIMTRLPREGENKTRLIPALVPVGATQFHDRLARHAIGRASSFAMMRPGTRLSIHLAGGSARDGREWLGEVDCRIQPEGHLGQRMQAAVEQAFSDGAGRVVVIGTDCPSLDESLLGEAFDALERQDLVFGPAADGGYYLVGLSKFCHGIFNDIDWGGSQVLNQSLVAARREGVHAALLEVRPDVDLPEDLVSAVSELDRASTLSVIIPTLNEERGLVGLLGVLRSSGVHEVIVTDGGSSDCTVEVALQAGVKVVTAPQGRASQMNLAASMATGEFLLFLHADTLPPSGFPQIIERMLQSPATSAGAFRFELGGDLSSAPLIESLVHLRCQLLGAPYGDQGLFIRRRIFRHLGGFPDWPVMEDLHLVRRLNRLGPVRTTRQPAITSSRRWESGGTVRTFFRHQLMLLAYFLGLPPRHIARIRW